MQKTKTTFFLFFALLKARIHSKKTSSFLVLKNLNPKNDISRGTPKNNFGPETKTSPTSSVFLLFWFSRGFEQALVLSCFVDMRAPYFFNLHLQISHSFFMENRNQK